MKTLPRTCIALAFALIAGLSHQEAQAYETGDGFVGHEMPTRLMLRYEQMGQNEHVTYPAHVFGANLSTAEAERVLEYLSTMASTITAAMYGHHGFMVRSVTFTLESNGGSAATSGDPVPFNVNAGASWWGMGYKNNQLGILESWARSPDLVNHPLWHELAHFFQARHLDEGDGWWTRSNMNGRSGEVPVDYCRLGGDDMAAAVHMYRYATDPDAEHCPEFHSYQDRGVCPAHATGCDYPNVTDFPDGWWRCDPDREDNLEIQIRNKSSGDCLTVANSDDGAPISSVECDLTDPAQSWHMLADDDGSFRFQNQASGGCMQVRGSSRGGGTVIEHADCNDADSNNAIQKFYPFEDGSGHYSLRLELSGLYLQANGDAVVQQLPDGDASQRWSLSSCGDGEVEAGEECEIDADCSDGGSCIGCFCEGGSEPAPGTGGSDAAPNTGGTAPGAGGSGEEQAAGGTGADWDPYAGGSAPIPGEDANSDQGADSTTSDAAGCSCRTTGSSGDSRYGFWALLLPFYLAWRRQRRSMTL